MAALRRMLPHDRGVIVQVGSALAYRGILLQAAYCGAKHAIQGFNDSLYAELLHDKSNVRLTMVNLPAINTPQFDWSRSKMPRRAQPVPPIFQPEVAAHAIVWAADHHRRELNLWQPVAGDHGAHGRFDDRALDRSIALDLNLNRSRIGPVMVLATSALIASMTILSLSTVNRFLTRTGGESASTSSCRILLPPLIADGH